MECVQVVQEMIMLILLSSQYLIKIKVQYLQNVMVHSLNKLKMMRKQKHIGIQHLIQ
jgi:hypothetical protein